MEIFANNNIIIFLRLEVTKGFAKFYERNNS